MLSVQNPYNLLNRTYESWTCRNVYREKQDCLPTLLLASGYLSGKYRNNTMPKNSRIERDGDFWTRYE